MLMNKHPFLDKTVNHEVQRDLPTPISLAEDRLAYLNDHGFQGMAVLPGAAYLEMIMLHLMGSENPAGSEHPLAFSLSNISFDRLFLLGTDTSSASFQVLPAGQDMMHVVQSGQAEVVYARAKAQKSETLGLASEHWQTIKAQCQKALPRTTLYQTLRENGNEYDTAFQVLDGIKTGENALKANLLLPKTLEAGKDDYIMHPVLLDACLQAAIALQRDKGQTFLVKGIEALHGASKISEASAVCATVRSDRAGSNGAVYVDVYLLNNDDALVAALTGVEIQQIQDEQSKEPSNTSDRQVAVAATFTVDPIAPSVAFWMDQWETPADVVFAPYNQPFQQLLDPNSTFSNNTAGFNAIMVRFEDWMQRATSLSAADDQLDRVLANRLAYTLPNQVRIAHLNNYESEYLFQEIFADRAYLRHGISIKAGDCVIDVGANIGMFTLFALSEAEGTRVYAFEPSPPAFEALNVNASLYGGADRVKAFNCGLSDRDGEAPFTFYRHSSVFSSYHANEDADHLAVKTVVENALQQVGDADETALAELTDEMMTNRMESETFACPIRTLSSIIEEEGIQQIDLLKVDVEKSEREVLMGIEPRHWPMIKQIVLEVHDTEGPLIKEVTEMLQAQGFDLEIEEEDLLEKSGLYNIYGTRNGKREVVGRSQDVSGQLEQTVQDFMEALQAFDQRSSTPLVVGVCAPSPAASVHAQLFAEMESSLVAGVASMSNIYLLSQDDWAKQYPVDDIHDADSDKLGHVPYKNGYFAAMGSALVRKFRSIVRKPYKVIIADCDQTLWKGVVGEDGPEGIAIDEARSYLQRFLVERQQEGMLLCLCSKNVEEDVLKVFDVRNDMPLRMEKIVSHRINWQAKSDNIKSLAEELQLGLDSMIFIDDNPVECAEVRARCPEVLTLQLPADPEEIPDFLNHVWAFDKTGVTEEDARRTEMYRQNAARETFKANTLDFASFIEALALSVEISAPVEQDLLRLSQMTNRTNQFNVSTVRRTAAELSVMLQEGTEARVVRVQDRFGDYGIVGAVLFNENNDTLVVDTFLLSCRVLGKGVEYQILQNLGAQAVAGGKAQVIVPYIPTRKNEPAKSFLNSLPIGSSSSLDSMFDQISAASDSATGPGVQFVFDAANLSRLTFDPSSVGNESTEQKAVAPASSGTVSGIEPLKAQEIADNYRSVEQILAAFGVSARRKRDDLPGTYVAPANSLEQQIAEIWEEILQIDKVGRYDHFFEMGGTSLKAVQAISRLKEQMDVDIAAVSLFDRTTVKEVAELIEEQATEAKPASDASVRQRGSNRRAMRGRRRRS